MNARDTWRPILDAEIKRWEAKTRNELIFELANIVTYEVEFDSKKYQIEIQILEDTDRYVHVGITVDDASFWGSIRPLSSCFLRYK